MLNFTKIFIFLIILILIFIIIQILYNYNIDPIILSKREDNIYPFMDITGGYENFKNIFNYKVNNVNSINTNKLNNDNTNNDNSNKLNNMNVNKISNTDEYGGYDEYDDNDLLIELDNNKLDNFDNIVVDGNNFIHKIQYNKSSKRTSAQKIDTKTIIKLLNESLDILTFHFPNKNIYFVFKDPENDYQEEDLMKITKTKSVREAHKKLFTDLVKKYPKTRFIVAYGSAKYRDDYAAIWLSDILPDNTILLSRDRYKDVGEMESKKIKFITYGKRAKSINKLINKPFNYVTKGTVKSSLIGYSFNNELKSGFYNKLVNKNSSASDIVYIFGK